MKPDSKIQVVIEFTKLNGGNIKKNAFKKRLPENKIVNSHPNCRTKPACNGLLLGRSIKTTYYKMEISGRIIAALPARSGTSARTGNTWMSQEFVIETHEQYPRKCVFTVFGEDRLKEMNIEVGKEMTVSFDIDAHEYNGRWFNDIRAWRAVPLTPATVGGSSVQPGMQPNQPVMNTPTATAEPAPANAEDDLPF